MSQGGSVPVLSRIVEMRRFRICHRPMVHGLAIGKVDSGIFEMSAMNINTSHE